MLPNFSRLDLRHNSAPTGQFYVLTEEQVATIGIDSITLEPFEAWQGRNDPHATFRVRNKNVNTTTNEYDYNWYVASLLWQWVKDNYKLPNTGDPIWFEDWWALHDQYAPGAVAPARVADLPKLKPDQPDTHEYAAAVPDDDEYDDTDDDMDDDDDDDDDPVFDDDDVVGVDDDVVGVDGMVPNPRNDLADIFRELITYYDDEDSYHVTAVVDRIIDSSHSHGDDYDLRMETLLVSHYMTVKVQEMLQYDNAAEHGIQAKGAILQLYAHYAEKETVRDELRDMDPHIGTHVRMFIADLVSPLYAGDTARQTDWTKNRLRDARRVLHFLNWDTWVANSVLLPTVRVVVNNNYSPYQQEEQRKLVEKVQHMSESLISIAPMVFNNLWLTIMPLISSEVSTLRAQYAIVRNFPSDIATRIVTVQLFQSVIRFFQDTTDLSVQHGLPLPGPKQALEVLLTDLVNALQAGVQTSKILGRSWQWRPQPLTEATKGMEMFFWRHVAPLYEGQTAAADQRGEVEDILVNIKLLMQPQTRPREADDADTGPSRRRQRISARYV